MEPRSIWLGFSGQTQQSEEAFVREGIQISVFSSQKDLEAGQSMSKIVDFSMGFAVQQPDE